ncbi:Rad4-domain-containing protein [Clavulina sp. PMI_390]|nr:Rad4-domain-containing protein [Clavulina sp. PMI_390]
MSSEDESDDMEWEEIVPVAEEQTKTVTLPSTSNVPFEITIKAPPPKASDAELRKQKAQADALRRIIRLTSHRLHTIALLVNASIRNKWAKDELLHARLMSLTPLPIQTSFSMITKRAQPDKTVRGRQFEAALVRLAEWWATTFRVDSNLGIRHQTFELGSSILQSLEPVSAADPKGKGKAKARPKDEEGEDVEAYDFSSLKYGERIRTVNSMMKHALMMRGSPDLSAQLFTALCRALDLPARLVVSLQPVLWRREKTDKEKAVDRAIQKSRKVAKEKEELIREATMIAAMSRSASGKPRTLDSAPVFWTEVYSRPDGRWLPVNPITGLVDRNRGFEPVQGDKFNHMMYVVAFEEDGFIKDVTPRYAKNYVTKVLKERSTNERPDWWSLVLSFMTRTYRLHRDDVEEAEFDAFQVIEGMPTSVGAFKNHPLYALERHLRQDEVIYPKTEIGKFRGEPVYARHSVTPLKSAENWLRTSGRTVKEGEQSLRYGKIKAATINKRRAIEMAAAESAAAGEAQSESSLTQGLYARWQTEAFVPEPVVDGKVPKNEFGNIDLYTPSMLPAGAAHVPFKGTAKIARQLGIDYAEAVTGFEFRQRRAFPIINGIVVPTEHAQTITEAYEASAQAAQEKEQRKRQERVIKLWTKIIQGLRIRDRIEKQYGSNPDATTTVAIPVNEVSYPVWLYLL